LVRNKFYNFYFTVVDIFIMVDILIINLFSAAFNSCRPSTAYIIDGIKNHLRALVYQNTDCKILVFHSLIVF